MSDTTLPNAELNAEVSPEIKPKRSERTGQQTSASPGLLRYEGRMGLLFVAPAMILFVVFVLFPALAAFLISFTNYDVLSRIKWVGLANYQRLTTDLLYQRTLLNVVQYVLVFVPLMIICSLGIALLLNRNMPGMKFFRTVYYIPVITSPVAASVIWLWLLQKDEGLVDQFTALFNIPGRAWVIDADTAMLTIVLVTLWQGIGANMVIYLAGLQGIPDYLYEAAQLDGADMWQTFRFVTWPSLRTTTFFVVTLSLIGAFQLFDQSYVLTSGGPGNLTRTPVYQIWETGFQRLRMGYASSQAFVLFLIIVFVTIINLRINREQQEALT